MVGSRSDLFDLTATLSPWSLDRKERSSFL